MGNTSAHPSGSSSTASVGAREDDLPPLLPEDVKALPLIPHHVYALLSEHVYREPTRRPLPRGWRMLVSCDELGLEREGFFAAAYINERLRHCIIAQRGTSDALGIRAGIWMYFDEPTIQFSLSEQFSKLVRLRLALTKQTDQQEPYFVSYTGHSLGAVLAACRAVAEHTFAITFESPGCRAFVEKTMHPFRADDGDIITYLRSPNPINTLRPHAGYLVQLPYAAPPTKDGRVDPTVPSGLKTKLSFSLPSAHDYLRSRILERNLPEVQEYLTRLEPVLRELFNRTQQVHSIASIVSNFEGPDDEPPHQDVVLTWPSHLMQFLEYFNVTKAMEEPINQNTNTYQAYENLLQRLYLVAKRPRHKLPIRFVNRDSVRLLRLWGAARADQRRALPVSDLDRRALATLSVDGETMASSVLTAFQAKMYLALLVSRSAVRIYLDNFSYEKQQQAKL